MSALRFLQRIGVTNLPDSVVAVLESRDSSTSPDHEHFTQGDQPRPASAKSESRAEKQIGEIEEQINAATNRDELDAPRILMALNEIKDPVLSPRAERAKQLLRSKYRSFVAYERLREPQARQLQRSEISAELADLIDQLVEDKVRQALRDERIVIQQP